MDYLRILSNILTNSYNLERMGIAHYDGDENCPKEDWIKEMFGDYFTTTTNKLPYGDYLYVYGNDNILNGGEPDDIIIIEEGDRTTNIFLYKIDD